MTEKLLLILLRGMGLYHFLIGFLAYLFPSLFYELASYTGSYNQHFIQDVGAAYLSAGSMLILAGFIAKWRVPLSIAGGTFLFLHALLHLWEAFTGSTDFIFVVMEILTVLLPTIVVASVPVSSLSNQDRSSNIKPN